MLTFQGKLPNPIQKIGTPQIVKTPEALVSNILDSFPKEIWTNKEKKWLVPVSKTGVFELEIYTRLMNGIAHIIPDLEERRAWIVRNMIWSFAPTVACEFTIRRNYLGKVWNNLSWQKLEGNVQTCNFLDVKLGKNGEVMVKEVSGKETYVKFDCVVGNPPYQDSAKNGRSDPKNLYPDFALQAMQLNPEYISMVIPARWMSGSGKGIQKFLETMIGCKKITKIVSTDNSQDWFSDVDIKGGTMYFLYDQSNNGTVIEINGEKTDLSGESIIMTDAVGRHIRNKVLKAKMINFSEVMLGTNPFGIASNYHTWSTDVNNSYICHCSGGHGKGDNTNLIAKSAVLKNQDIIERYKVCIATAYGKGADGFGEPFIIGADHIVSQSYAVLFTTSSADEAENAKVFLQSRLAQYLVSLVKRTQDNSKRVFRHLPVLDFTKSYSDQDLYTMFNLSTDEISHIENTTKNFPIFKVKIAKAPKIMSKKLATNP